MKKKSAPQSAFFNSRVLIGLFIVLAGVFLALAGLGTFSAIAASSARAQKKPQQKHKIINIQGLPPGFDCSTIYEKGFNKMESLRAGLIMIACGEAEGGSPSPSTSPYRAFSRLVQKVMAPLAYGAADVDLITGTETPPHIIQSETFTTANPDNPDQIVVAFNDSRCATGNNFSGASVSTDGGATFTRLTTGSGCSPFTNTFGDPVILYHKPSGTWLTVWIDANGGCTMGGYKSTTPWDPNSWTHFCVHSGISDDRESGYADNNPSSPFFGRLYVSWNDFGQSQQIRVTHSTDGGVTWSSPVNVNNTFIRNVQITSDKVTGDVYIAGMDEMGGGLTNRANKIYRSTDGGDTWTNTYTGPTFPGPGRSAAGFFADMYANPPYWRHMGWGEPAAYNHVVSLVYAARNTGNGDPGDVFYIRSTDMGVTFSAPFQLNSNTDSTKAQWEPNLSASDAGTLLATWYDETPRVAASCQPSSPSTPCYQMHSRKSNDNGLTWLSDDTLSDVASPLPLQQDPFIVTEYVGDYDYGSSILTKHVTSWVDGRVIISGASQQDAFTDRELVGFAVTTSDPACNSVVNTQPTDFIINLSDAVNTGTVDPTDFTVNGTPSDLPPTFANGDTQITFHYTSSPVTTQGPQTMFIPANAFTRVSDGQGNFEFNCTFCYAVMPLQVTSTNPPVGGTFSPPAPGDYQYDVNFNQAVDSGSVETTDLILTGSVGGSVTAVSVNGSTATFTVHFNFGGSVTASIGANTITAFGCNGNEAFSGTYTVEGCPPGEYTITPGTDTIVPGTTDTGNHIDDGSTFVPLPFPFTLYDQTYNGVYVDSNGRLDFVCTAAHDLDWVSVCLPATDAVICPYTYTVFGLWTDQCTDNTAGNCGGDFCTGCGIFTSISGSAPDRIFNIEWRTVLYGSGGTTPDVHHEVRLYENPNQNQRFDVIYGDINSAAATQMWVAGVQKDETSGSFTQDFCIPVGGSPPTNESRMYEIPPCASPSPTPTATATVSATPTATATATATASVTATPTATASQTPRSTPTPRPYPTPAPHRGNCYLDSSNCSGIPNLVTTCFDCLVTGNGMSWSDGGGCHTTCPSQ